MAGFLTASCATDDKYFEVMDILFERQVPLVTAFQAGAARAELLRIAAAAGVTEAEFDACLRDSTEIERIQTVSERGAREHGVTGTPTLIINGETYPALSIDQLAAIIDPLLPASG
jgi:protein-disulfide isomerase